MKKLLEKSLRQLTIFAFAVFTLSIPSYLFLVDWIWQKELDENNELIAQRIEAEFNEQKIGDQKLEESIRFWNEIQPVSRIEKAERPLARDSMYTVRRKNAYAKTEVIDRFRGLVTNISINKRNFILTIETNVEETEETVAYIALVTLLFFLVLVVGFWILNRRLSKKIWRPFKDTLRQLKSFQLTGRQQLSFQDTDIIEFAELNATLDRLIKHNIAVYQSQKEFTENASHELQTPLAILKSKLDILLQSDELTQGQYQIAEEMNKALIRSSRINKNLLLLAKIENSEFDRSQLISVDALLAQNIDILREHFDEKNISLDTVLLPAVKLKGNHSLIEVMFGNLLVNALRHAPSGGKVSMLLSEAVFELRNSGTAALDQDLLFKRFSRISSDNSGSGLGLSIIKEICRLHGWQVVYRFEENQHIFTINF